MSDGDRFQGEKLSQRQGYGELVEDKVRNTGLDLIPQLQEFMRNADYQTSREMSKIQSLMAWSSLFRPRAESILVFAKLPRR